MCGLTGFWVPPGPPAATLRRLVGSMADTMIRRGPDDEGTWVDADAGIAVGFRRLAILDLTPTGHQPMLSADGRYVIVFNGEIYNHHDLRHEVEARGVRVRGGSDTEVIIEAAALWGADETVPRLWGMFAIAIWDRRERSLLLARDRLGKKPLYYLARPDLVMFASQLDAFRRHPSFTAEVDRDALAVYLRFGCVPAPYAIYRGVRKLPPGTCALIRPGRPVVVRPYWDPRRVVEDGLAAPLAVSDSEAADELDVLLRDAVGRRMIADVPLGAFLSGGVDSSTVVALMQAQSPRPVKTFTIGFHVDGYDEAQSAKAVAAHLGTDHHELYVTPAETQAVIPHMPVIYDEPFADPSQVPTYLVARLARERVTVGLSGDGGDELFGGYTRYAWATSIWRGVRRLPPVLRRRAADVILHVRPGVWNGVYRSLEWALPPSVRQTLPGDKLHKLAALLSAADQGALYRGLVSLWQRPNELVVGGQEPPTWLDDASVGESVPDFVERMMFLDLVSYLPDDILVKVDRASMGVSLEARAPLLDHRLVEWVWRLPLRFKRRHGRGKWLLRQVLQRYVPPALIDRPKMGFGVPLHAWLRGPLRDWAEALLDERRLRDDGFLRPEPIRAVWAGHLGGHRNDQYRLWTILMFQAWLDAKVCRSAAGGRDMIADTNPATW